MTPANKGGTELPAELAEERSSAKRNVDQDASRWTPSRDKRGSRGLLGLREGARKNGAIKFTALLHHVNEECLLEAFCHLKKMLSVEVDEIMWHEYEQNVESYIADLHGRIHF